MSKVGEPIVENTLDDNRIMLMQTMMLMLLLMFLKCNVACNFSQSELTRTLEDNKLLLILMSILPIFKL